MKSIWSCGGNGGEKHTQIRSSVLKLLLPTDRRTDMTKLTGTFLPTLFQMGRD
jgi:hypothetical protein